jgi:hypothetical protein
MEDARGTEVIIQSPTDPQAKAPTFWLVSHPEWGVQMFFIVEPEPGPGRVKLDRRQLGTLHTAIGHILEKGVDHVTPESMMVTLGE